MITSIFDPAIRKALILRIQSLNDNSQRQWGKMTVCEMAKHMNNWNEWVLGKKEGQAYRQDLLGKIFGKLALRSQTKDNTPMRKGMPAGPHVIKKFSGDLEMQKKAWIENVEAYANYSNPRFVHDFFGKMTDEQIGIFAYKHADHHLRQFGV
ncbi:DUF1569 domain-containing protein [Pseudoflavitalea rhizosphaerae]|uniref:DUF1569 domain-containing protein n=1 Tax=Pseudoflavitalea rhizosphaerae TaxID=1884793 RepID=UPI001F498B22|nr:DUF1569 domain-containing protein [Pseudoflavitalea rhizosphaerae]